MSDKESINDTRVLEIKKENLVRGSCLFLLLFFAAVAVMIVPSRYNPDKQIETGIVQFISLLRNELGDVAIAHVLAVGGLGTLFNRELFRRDKPVCLTAFIIGGILSLFLLIGMSFSNFHNFEFMFGNNCQTIIAGIVLLGLWSILYTLLKVFYNKVDTLSKKKYEYNGIIKYIDANFFSISLVTMLICWAALGVFYFPGSVPHDGRNQLNMVFGFSEWKIHHPFFSTMFLKIIYESGYKLFGAIGGCIFYIIFQSLLAGIVFSMICNYFRKKTKNVIPALICLTYFAIAPMWWTFMQAVMKDALYFIAFSLFSLEVVKVFWGDTQKRDWYLLSVAAIASCVLRNGSIVIIVFSLLVLWFVIEKNRKVVALVTLSVVFISVSSNVIIVNGLGLTSVNQVEALSIPLQQIARYVSMCENELTEEEKSIIDCVIEYDGIAERYNPELSDPIKNRYKNTTEEQWERFWKLWFEKLLEHPDIYITATMNHVYGYIDPFYFFTGLTTYQLYNNKPLRENDVDINYSEYFFSDEIRALSADTVYIWNKIPIASFVVNPAFYTWIGIIMIGALLRKRKWKETLLFVAPLISLFICFASPVNGYLRYSTPVMAAIPVYILLSILPYLGDNQYLSKGEGNEW